MKKFLLRSLFLIAFVLLVFFVVSSLSNGQRFSNSEIDYRTDMVGALRAWLDSEQRWPEPNSPIPLRVVPGEDFDNSSQAVLYRLGHSTVLIRLDGKYILTDPVFSDRTSPVQWMGPQRFHPPPLSVSALPLIDVVIVSHDHYDHLDKRTVLALAEKTKIFLLPLKVGQHLRRWGIEDKKIVELDWWESYQVDRLTLTATPAQHFSGRSLFDKDKTLWASWAIQGQQGSLFFSGDSGYFSGFKEIGERLGPFDITMIENGAYHPSWNAIHMSPADSVRAHLDLRGKAMLPIHNGTFNLAFHDWFDPFEQVSVIAERSKVNLLTPVFGESVQIASPKSDKRWWQAIQESQLASK